jgi:hypothetical protein
MPVLAGVAQLVEHFTRNEGVSGSNPLAGFSRYVCTFLISLTRRLFVHFSPSVGP